jgi:hypothetical protein
MPSTLLCSNTIKNYLKDKTMFGYKKKKSDCCTINIEEVKEEKKQKENSSCCDIKIEEVKEDKTTDESNEAYSC